MDDNEQPGSGVSLQEYSRILRRRRATILQSFVLISVVGLVLTALSKPVYQASAKLLVEGPSLNVNTVDNGNPLSSILTLNQQQTVATDVEVLQAQPLLARVAQTVGPATLSVATLGDTNVIEVGAEANDPKIAADAANTLLTTYVDQDADQDFRELETARKFVETQGTLARRRLDASEMAMERFKRLHHVSDLERTRDDQVARTNELTTELQKAQTELASLHAQSGSNRARLAKEPDTLPVSQNSTNTARASLSEDVRRLDLQRLSLTQIGGYGPQAPPILALDAQVNELRRELADTPAQVVTKSSAPNVLRETLRGRQADLDAQEAALAATVAETQSARTQAGAGLGDFAGWEVTLARLTREHDAAGTSDKAFTDKLADLTLREKARHASARIIERAQPPTSPIRPKKAQSVVFGCLMGLIVGVCLALLQEFLDDRINSVEDAGRLLSLPSLGHVPALSVTDARLLPQMAGLDPAAESYRILRTNIHFASVDAPVRTLLVTSSNPGEGKTTTAANLAFAMAMDGKRVILVDTDLRRPSLHKLLELPAGPGLTDVLLGHAGLSPHAVLPNLSVITCGSTPPNPSELLNSRTFRSLVETLTEQADIVIFDSPPVLVAADAAILASQMDGTVFIIETGVTRKAAARQTVRLLHQARANVLGIAYNKMRVRDDAGYYYYQYQYGTPASLNGTGRPVAALAEGERAQGEDQR